jgi:hypothetical protein
VKWKELSITIDKNIPRSSLNSNGKGCHHNSIESNHVVV